MNTEFAIKVELNAMGERFMTSIQTRNEELEKSVERGFQLAIDELTNGDTLENLVKEEVKKKIISSFTSYTFQSKMTEIVQKAMYEKLSTEMSNFSDKFAEELKEKLSKI